MADLTKGKYITGQNWYFLAKESIDSMVPLNMSFKNESVTIVWLSTWVRKYYFDFLLYNIQ